jgi:hypothetical protein
LAETDRSLPLAASGSDSVASLREVAAKDREIVSLREQVAEVEAAIAARIEQTSRAH